MSPQTEELMRELERALVAAQAEIIRLRKDPDDTLSDHPGCVYCMEAGTPVKDGEVCPKCGDRLPTRRVRRLEAELAAALKAKEEAEAQRDAAVAHLRRVLNAGYKWSEMDREQAWAFLRALAPSKQEGM